ncbi:type II toxin-antitoxin system RelE/ParE family toxin [Nostoc sp. C052]|uniref:type II toxin-antitoxin system RelE family toxin n=1 Tax=Nostoc sp. C052 TaxID=2576902 RepID=UPI001C4CBC21
MRNLAFDEIPQILTFEEITNLKKLQGYENAYRIRVGDYRIGLIFDGEIVLFQRVLHRKDIYRYFPK